MRPDLPDVRCVARFFARATASSSTMGVGAGAAGIFGLLNIFMSLSHCCPVPEHYLWLSIASVLRESALYVSGLDAN